MEKSPSLPEIIELLSVSLKESPRIHAMWLEGSYATGKFNEQSDIDVWLDVNDGAFDEYISTFRQALASVIEIAYESGKKAFTLKTPSFRSIRFIAKVMHLKTALNSTCKSTAAILTSLIQSTQLKLFLISPT